MKMPADPSSRPMSIVGPYDHERARLDGTFTDVDREWRKKWLKSQELSHHEPRPIPPEMNPIRRAMRFPLDFVFSKLEPVLGKHTSSIRYATGKYLIAFSIILGGHYYFKYNSHDWSRKKGWAVYTSRPIMYPNDPGFPNVPKREPSDYADYGFKKSGF